LTVFWYEFLLFYHPYLFHTIFLVILWYLFRYSSWDTKIHSFFILVFFIFLIISFHFALSISVLFSTSLSWKSRINSLWYCFALSYRSFYAAWVLLYCSFACSIVTWYSSISVNSFCIKSLSLSTTFPFNCSILCFQ